MPKKRNLDNVRGSWLALIALACVGLIFGLGLGSERVRRVVRDVLPAALGGSSNRQNTFWEEQAQKNPPPPDKKEVDPDALPDVPKEDSYRGIVRDSAGKPLAGATVTAERWRESRWEVLATGKTNKAGEFVVGPVPRAYLSAVARAEGYASERKPAKTGARLEFNLKKGGNLAGKVVDAVTGEPVAECYLSGWSQRGDWYETARTGKDGAFRFTSVPPGPIWLNIVPVLHLETSLGDLEVFEGKDTYKEIPVVKGGKLKGRVLDRETKAPVAGAKVRTWDGTKNAVSGEDGKFEIQSPAAGWNYYKISAKEYPEQWSWFQSQGDPTQDFERDLEISKGAKVSGVVLKSDGTPAPGARVGREAGDLMTGVPEDTTVADAEGKFTLDAVPAYEGIRLFAFCEGYALSRSDPLDLHPGSEMAGIRLTLQAGATFRGVCKDEEGEPVAGVSVSYSKQWDNDNWQDWYWIPELVAYSLADGTWELTAVPEGKYQVRATAEGYAPETRSEVNAPREGEIEGQDFVLRKGSAITGRLRNRAGELLAGVSVTAWGWVMGSEGNMEWVQRNEVRTDNEGLFLMDGLRDGSYELNFQSTGYAPLQMPGIATGTRDLQVMLLQNARVEGLVLEADGVTPVPTFSLRVYLEVDGDGNPQGPGNMIQNQDFADREGKFVLKDVPEGQVALVAVSGSKISRRLGGIVVAAGGVAGNLRLQLSVGGRLKVTVRDTGGSALKDANVAAGRLQPDGSFMNEYWAQTDGEGVAMFSAMADGTWSLWANYHGKVQETKTVNVGGGVEAELDMVLRLGGALLIQVRDGKGQPVEGATVAVVDATSGQELPLDWNRIWQSAWEKYGGRVDWNRVQREATQTDAEGRHLRQSLKPGSVKVRVRKQGFVEASVPALVQDGFEVDVAVRLEAVPDPNAPAPEK
jgi:5-hydroxyisourate hydrolase-like protein (transthyretin family)/protocatechuate 3,4-dioxygenase beta subunit